MQTKWDFAGSTDMWSTSAGGHLMKVVNLTGFTVYASAHTHIRKSRVFCIPACCLKIERLKCKELQLILKRCGCETRSLT
jgi:hypothetical protein